MSDDITIRELATQAEYAACVALQRDTWGKDFNDAVPASILLVAQKVGGVAAGAFDAHDRLLGFVFGITGVEHGNIVHWSDMLAVRPDARNLGLGRRLKAFQRAHVARVGGCVIYWTYDPLVSRNAHLNFNVFGVRVKQYARDLYGSDTGSDLHRGIGTDRLVVAWPVNDAELVLRQQETAVARTRPEARVSPILGEAERSGSPSWTEASSAACVRIAVPRDITTFLTQDLTRAAKWRAATRAAFEAALAARFRVDGFYIDEEQDRGFYVLGHP